jgi:hypothetical protein
LKGIIFLKCKINFKTRQETYLRILGDFVVGKVKKLFFEVDIQYSKPFKTNIKSLNKQKHCKNECWKK